MCGEHDNSTTEKKERLGSSPHVRGTRFRRGFPRWRLGIIPACAGNTSIPVFSSKTARDHPRMCGEHRSQLLAEYRQTGSSPHVRGTPGRAAGIRVVPGIIPACAGNTRPARRVLSSPRDHPRMCGEHFSGALANVKAAGSSPHVRGTREASPAASNHQGIIPACAGNTRRVPLSALE